MLKVLVGYVAQCIFKGIDTRIYMYMYVVFPMTSWGIPELIWYIAQLVEHLHSMQYVAGSSPIRGSSFFSGKNSCLHT